MYQDKNDQYTNRVSLLHHGACYARFRKTLPVPVLAVEVLAFAAVVLRTPPVAAPLREAVAPFFAGAPLATEAFLITVPLLVSLDSLLAIDLRPVRVAGRETGGREVAFAGTFLFFATATLLEFVLIVEDVVTLRATPPREAFAFSTMLVSIFAAAAERDCEGFFNGEAGRAMPDLIGDTGRFAIREFDEVGDNTCAGRIRDTSPFGIPLTFFFAFSLCSISFSLSPEIASL